MEQILSAEETHSTELSLYLPKFKMETTFLLNDALIQLGIRNAFSYQSADFTGIVKEKDMRDNIYISRVNISLIPTQNTSQYIHSGYSQSKKVAEESSHFKKNLFPQILKIIKSLYLNK
jgi:hypothetical protein